MAARKLTFEDNHHDVDGKHIALSPDVTAQDQCTGNACGVVAVTWNGQGYNISNHSGRNVKVRIRWAFGFQCMDWTDIPLGPNETKQWGHGGYCNPYEANYV